jgi:GH24 family phage-related lysozyme (muramidase)
MNEDELTRTLLDLEHFEGRTTWLYRDSADAGNVTIGIGCLIPNVAAALDLLFQVRGQPATEAQVQVEWERVMGMAPKLRARRYRNQDVGARVELSDHAVNEIAVQRLRKALTGLHLLVEGFEELPHGPRAGLVDLCWCLGIGKLSKWHHLLAAVARRDWKTAGFESHVAGGREDRNIWRRRQFEGAAG